MDFDVPSEYKIIHEAVREFVDHEIVPLEDTFPEAPDIPDDVRHRLQQKAKDVGLWAYNVPEALGGGGLGRLATYFVEVETGRALIPPLRAPSVLTPTVAPALQYCKGEQIERYLMPVIDGRMRTAFSITEPWGGSDPAGNMRTRAQKVEGGWILNGSKVFCSVADKADVIQVFALTDETKRARGGITCFLVEKNQPGFRLGQQFRMMIADAPWELIFQDCFVPDDQVLGEVGEGFRMAQERLTEGRISHGAKAVGRAERALQLALAHIETRSTFGQRLSSRQSIQWMLADSAVEIHTTRLMALHASWKLDQGADVRQESFMVKLQATEMLNRVCDRVLQIFGGMGLSVDLPIERMFRDARSRRIGEGTSEIHRMAIARNLMRDPSSTNRVR